MSANPHRRSLIGLFATAPLAAAAGIQPASALGRARAMSLSVRATDGFSGVLGRARDQLKGLESSIPGIGAVLDRAHPLELDIEPASARFSSVLSRLDSNPASITAQRATEARAIAAAALVYPPEIAAYRSFGAPMRRRLYAELLTRESERLAAASSSPSITEGTP